MQAQSLAAGHMAGTIQIPGHAVASQECPPDLLEAEPSAPKLNLMVARNDLFPEVPTSLIRQWMGTEMSSELQKFLDALHEEFGPTPEARTTAAADPNANNTDSNQPQPNTPAPQPDRKRKGERGGGPSTGKRAKVDRAKIQPSSESRFSFNCFCWKFCLVWCRH